MKKLLFLFLFLGSLSVIAQDAWTQLNDFPFEAFTSGSFVVEEEAYIIVRTGQNQNNFPSAMYKYDLGADVWEFVIDIPEETRNLGDPFVVNNRVFLVGQTDESIGIELWEFDHLTTTFQERTGYLFGDYSLTGYFATSFSINGLGYVMSFPNDSNQDLNFASYDPETDSWTERANFPGPNAGGGSGAFVINEKGYIIFGEELKIGPMNELWMYDPVLDFWEEKTPRESGFLADPAIFVIQDLAYVGLGRIDIGVPNSFYTRYDPSSDSWETVTAPSFVSKNPFSFAINGIGYVGVGDESIVDIEPTNKIWRLDPALLSVSEVTPEMVSLYPNPTADVLFIESTSPIQKATVYSVLGQAVLTEQIENNQLDVSSLSKGVYLLELRNSTGVFTQRLIKD